ncbi:MAG TPA: DUF1080 domain-containing protein [Gemmatales bacterium]|nr:DUF1080 domain-containing protein [Gemmatales bacterium]
MYSFLGLALLFAFPPVHDNASELLPPGITMEKAFEGWIALYDGATDYGWKTTGDVKIEKGILTLGGEKPAAITTNSAFGAIELVIHYRIDGAKGGFQVTGPDSKTHHKESSTPPASEYKHFTLSIPNADKAGPVSLTTDPGTTLHIQSIVLKPLGAKPIFNGKDLTGWKEIPGKKSKFSVNSAGELNVKDGPGDLQTVGQWDDFILQLDIISNGDHLNSGIFYRCLPDIFWSGYEAQVRNEWQSTVKLKNGKSYTSSVTITGDNVKFTGEGKKSMTVPKSEVDSITDHRDRPIDIGSGGIYNRCPARKVVSTDRQWYTMTVLANGNHHAVWVNGYQTADFIDTKPINKSARQGRKDEAGPLSIQGHDPTTDLNFKNIRILALPK